MKSPSHLVHLTPFSNFSDAVSVDGAWVLLSENKKKPADLKTSTVKFSKLLFTETLPVRKENFYLDRAAADQRPNNLLLNKSGAGDTSLLRPNWTTWKNVLRCISVVSSRLYLWCAVAWLSRPWNKREWLVCEISKFWQRWVPISLTSF